MPLPRRAVGLAALLFAAAACERKGAIERVIEEQRAPDPGKDPVKLEVVAESNEVALGDDIVFHVKLTNSGGSTVQVNRPRIDRRSVTFRVRREDGSIGKVERIVASLDRRMQFVHDASEAVQLAAGETLDQEVPTVAVQTGKLAFTASYVRQGAAGAIAAPPVEVTVREADPKAPRLGVKIETTQGPYTAVFRPDVAYNTVESFASLVKKGFYTGLTFHRIVSDFMAQGGDPQGTGEGGPGYFLPLEADPAKLPHTRGVMSMARTGIPDTAGSQFFVMFATRPDLDQGRYTTFAQMAEGEETLKRLQAVPVGPNSQGEPSSPKEKVVIQRATLVSLP